MDLHRLSLLADLERLGTMAAVADARHLTSSGVSMHLSALEREAAVPLLERRGRRVELTSAGRVLAAHARELLERLALAELDLQSLREGGIGRYGIGAFPSAARTVVPQAWQELSERPGLNLELIVAEPEATLALLATGTVDVAVVHSYSNVARASGDGVVVQEVGSEPLWLALPASDGATAPVDLADLRHRSWIVPPDDLTCRHAVDRACGLAGFVPRVVARSADFAAQLALVAAGVGVALIPDLTVAEQPGGVALLPLTRPVTRTLSVVIRAGSRTDPGLGTVVQALVAAGRSVLADRAAHPLQST